MTRRRPRRPAERHAHGHLYGHGHGVGGGMAVRHGYPADRRDRRRERRMRRRHGRGVRHVVLARVALLVGVVVGLALLVRVVIGLVQLVFPLLLVAGIAAVGLMLLRRTTRRTGPDTAVDAGGPPLSDRSAWERARTEFDHLRTEYSAHECDPMAVLRRPALTDVSVASTARFVDAFAEAQALDTDTWPGGPHDAAYVTAVSRATRAWQAAQDAADRIRLSGLTPAERTSVERVLKLLTTARDSDSEPERLAAYARARSELDRLDRAGVVHLPRTARAAIDEASRGALPG